MNEAKELELIIRQKQEVLALVEQQRLRDGRVYDPLMREWLFADGSRGVAFHGENPNDR